MLSGDTGHSAVDHREELRMEGEKEKIVTKKRLSADTKKCSHPIR